MIPFLSLLLQLGVTYSQFYDYLNCIERFDPFLLSLLFTLTLPLFFFCSAAPPAGAG
jgi:hypothetical protein